MKTNFFPNTRPWRKSSCSDRQTFSPFVIIHIDQSTRSVCALNRALLS